MNKELGLLLKGVNRLPKMAEFVKKNPELIAEGSTKEVILGWPELLQSRIRAAEVKGKFSGNVYIPEEPATVRKCVNALEESPLSWKDKSTIRD